MCDKWKPLWVKLDGKEVSRRMKVVGRKKFFRVWMILFIDECKGFEN
jgi:hypothetical protein